MAKYRKYHFNQEYFLTWSPQMAYILGLIAADGNVFKTTLAIGLQKRDKSLLDFVRSQIGKVPITERRQKNSVSVRIRYNSRIMADSLANLGIVPCKGAILSLDMDIPSCLKTDFVRGFFDGDGWVVCRRNTIESGIVGASEKALLDLREMTGVKGRMRERTKKGYDTPYYVWEMSSGDTMKLYEFMYREDVCCCLKRKRDVFESDWFVPSKRWWTPKQFRLLMDTMDMPLSELPSIIGKSYKAISKKRWEFRNGLGRNEELHSLRAS